MPGKIYTDIWCRLFNVACPCVCVHVCAREGEGQRFFFFFKGLNLENLLAILPPSFRPSPGTLQMCLE